MTGSNTAKDLFCDALERAASERQAYVESVCGGNAMLLIEVTRLLAAHAEASHVDAHTDGVTEGTAAQEKSGGFLVSPTGGAAEIGNSANRTREGPGSVIGPYRLLEQIGEGGFGVVFAAEQWTPIVRRIALKVCKPGMDTRQVIARFEAERQALAMMDHPGIARVFDAGETESGRPYFAMELVADGRARPITTFCDERALGIPERLSLFQQVCQAVQHAHQKGIIHRDLKPSNILIAEIDGRPIPKVIDFGIAKATAASALQLSQQTIFTDARQFIGTPEYMSPEQAGGSGVGDIDTRADIYALGVLLYELLTGTPPFDPRSLRSAAGGWDEMRRIIREEEPPRPSTRVSSVAASPYNAARRNTTTRLATTIRGDLDWIVMKCLEKDRNRRYQTANALAMDIDRHLSGEAVLAAPPSPLYRISKMVHRHSRLVLSAAVVLGLMTAGTTISTAQWQRAERQGAQTMEERDKAERIAEFMESILGGVSPGRAAGRDTTLLKEVMDSAAKRIHEGELASAPEAELRLRLTIGLVYSSIAEHKSARDLVEGAPALARTLYGPVHPMTLRAVMALGRVHSAELKLEEALVLFREAKRIQEQLFEGDHPDLVEILYHLNTTVLSTWDFRDALTGFEEALAMSRRLSTDDSSMMALMMRQAASAVQRIGNPEDALLLHNEAIAMQRRLGDDDIALADLLQGLAHCYAQGLKEVEASIPAHLEAIAIYERFYPDGHPLLAYTRSHYAACLLLLGERETAIEMLENSLADFSRFEDGPATFSFIPTRILVEALRQSGRQPEAELLSRELVAASLGTPPFIRYAQEGRVNVLIDLGRHEDALDSLRESLPLLPPDSQQAAALMLMMAHVILDADPLAADEAAPLVQSALAIFDHLHEANLLQDPHDMLWMRHRAASTWGDILSLRGDHVGAEPFLLDAYAALSTPANQHTGWIGINYRRRALVRIVALYDRWHEADPLAGHDAAAAQWHERLEASPAIPGIW